MNNLCRSRLDSGRIEISKREHKRRRGREKRRATKFFEILLFSPPSTPQPCITVHVYNPNLDKDDVDSIRRSKGVVLALL